MRHQHDTTEPFATCTVDGWRPTNRPGRVCEPCEKRMGSQLDYLAAAAPLLWVVAHTEPTAWGELNLTALDLAQHANTTPVDPDDEDQVGTPSIASILGVWVEAWGGRDVYSANAVSCCGWLRRNLHGRCDAGGGGIENFATALRSAYAQARIALNRDWRGTRYATPCPDCDTETLVRKPGADWIECTGCGWLWEEDEYVQMALGTMPAESLLYAHEAALVLAKKPDAVRRLVDRGRLVPYDHDDQGRARYTRAAVDQLQHELELWHANLAEVCVWTGDRAHPQFRCERLPGSARIRVGGAEIRLRRGVTVQIGPVADGETIEIVKGRPKPV